MRPTVIQSAMEFWSIGPGSDVLAKWPVEWVEESWYPSNRRMSGMAGGVFRYRFRWVNHLPTNYPPDFRGGFVVDCTTPHPDVWHRVDGYASPEATISFIHGFYIDKLREKADALNGALCTTSSTAGHHIRIRTPDGFALNVGGDSQHETIGAAMQEAFGGRWRVGGRLETER